MAHHPTGFGKWLTLLGVVSLLGGGTTLALYNLQYGISLFILSPVAIGFLLTTWRYVPGATSGDQVFHFVVGWSSILVFAGTAACLVLAMEGILCLIMAVPLVYMGVLFGCVIGMLTMEICSYRPGRPGRPLLALFGSAAFALLSGMDAALPKSPPLFQVESKMLIDAPLEVVWEHVIAFPELAPPTEWYFRAGIAYPLRARIIGEGVGAVRYCEFSTGAFVEPITTWDAPHRLAFDVTDSPPPMREWNPFHEIHPPHLNGFMEGDHGEFELQPAGENQTLLIGRTWYRHGLYPATYWSWWSSWLIERIHHRVLAHIKTHAEAQAPGNS